MAEVEALRRTWLQAPIQDIDADIDYFLAVVSHSELVERPHVIHIRRESGDLLVVARLERRPLPFRVGYRVVAAPKLRSIVASFDGVVGLEGPADAALVIRELVDSMRRGEADMIVLPKVDVDSPLHAAARQAVTRLRCGFGSRTVSRWQVALPGSIDEYLGQLPSKRRQRLRYYDRKLEKAFADDLTLRRFDRPSDWDRLHADIDRVAQRTYQYQLGAGLTRDRLQHDLMAFAAERRILSAWVLYIQDQPVSFWYGTRNGATFATGTPGFDPQYADHRVGTFTMLRMIEDLCADPAIQKLDLGHGDAEYKRLAGAEPRLQRDLVLFAPRIRPTALNLAYGFLAGGTSSAARVAGRWALGDRIKRRWRDRLATPAPRQPEGAEP